MTKLMIALAGVAVLGFAGCQGGAPVKQEAPQAAAKPPAAPEAAMPALSAQAGQALAQAEADVKAAQQQHALWTTAQDALKHAKAAAEKKDSAAVIKYSKVASEQANLGIAQKQYPVTGVGK